MRFATALVTLASAGTALAGRNNGDGDDFWRSRKCLPMNKVDEMQANYVALVSNIESVSANIENIMTEDFIEYSDSINALIPAPGFEPGQPTFSGRTAFLNAQLNANQQPITIEDVEYNCDSLTFVWHTDFGTGDVSRQARGISRVLLEKEKGGAQHGDGRWRFSRFDVEFNSIAWQAFIQSQQAP